MDEPHYKPRVGARERTQSTQQTERPWDGGRWVSGRDACASSTVGEIANKELYVQDVSATSRKAPEQILSNKALHAQEVSATPHYTPTRFISKKQLYAHDVSATPRHPHKRTLFTTPAPFSRQPTTLPKSSHSAVPTTPRRRKPLLDWELAELANVYTEIPPPPPTTESHDDGLADTYPSASASGDLDSARGSTIQDGTTSVATLDSLQVQARLSLLARPLETRGIINNPKHSMWKVCL